MLSIDTLLSCQFLVLAHSSAQQQQQQSISKCPATRVSNSTSDKLLRPVLVGVIGGSGLYHLDNLTFVYVFATQLR